MEELEQNEQQDVDTSALIEFLSKLYKSPKHLKKFRELAEELGYNIAPSEYEQLADNIKSDYEKKINELEGQVKELERSRERAVQARYQENIKQVLAQYGLDESHLPAISRYMQQNGIANIQSAIRYYAMDLQNTRTMLPSYNRPLIKENLLERYAKEGKEALMRDISEKLSTTFGWR